MRVLTWIAGVFFFLGVGSTAFLILDSETAERLLGGWPAIAGPAGRSAGVLEKLILLVKTSWLFYAILTLIAGLLWAALVRKGRLRPYRPKPRAADRSRPAESAGPTPAASAMEDFLTQFEINWKTFASYTQDLLHRKIKELEELPQKGVKEIGDKVIVVARAIEEVKKDIALVKDEIRVASRGVNESLGRALKGPSPQARKPDGSGEEAMRKLEADLRTAIEKFSRLDERSQKLVQVIEDERNGAVAKLAEEEGRRLEKAWSGKVASLTGEVGELRREKERLKGALAGAQATETGLRREIEQAAAREKEQLRLIQEASAQEKKRSQSLKDLSAELERTRSAEAGLRREVEQAEAREREAGRKLTEAVAEREKRAETVKDLSSQVERARKDLERKEKEFLEERRRLCSKFEELEAQGSVLESEKGDSLIEIERLKGVLEAREKERDRLRASAEGLQVEKDRLESESRRLLEEVKTLRSGRAKDRAKELVARDEENARLRRELESQLERIDSERSAREEAEKDLERRMLEFVAQSEKQARIAEEHDAFQRELAVREEEIRRLKAASPASPVAGSSQESGKALQAFRLEIERLEMARFEEAKKSQAAEAQIGRLKKELAAARERPGEIEEGAERLRELEREKSELVSSLDDLGKQLERLREDIDGFRRFQGTLIDGSIPAAIAAVDTNFKVFAWNPAAEALWGLPADGVLGRSLPELSIPGLGPETLSEVERAMRDRQTLIPPRASFPSKTGKMRHICWSCDPILGRSEEALGAVLIADDVTDEVEKQIEARVQGIFSRSLLRSLPAAVVVLDAQHRVISWNRGAETLLGVGESVAVGQDFFTLGIPLAKPAFQRRFEESEKDRGVHKVRVRFEIQGAQANYVVTQAPFYGTDETVKGAMLLIESVAEAPAAAK